MARRVELSIDPVMVDENNPSALNARCRDAINSGVRASGQTASILVMERAFVMVCVRVVSYCAGDTNCPAVLRFSGWTKRVLTCVEISAGVIFSK